MEQERLARGEAPAAKPPATPALRPVARPRPVNPVPAVAVQAPARPAPLSSEDFVFGKARTLTEEHCKMCMLIIPDTHHSYAGISLLLGITPDNVGVKLQLLKKAYNITAASYYLGFLAAKLEHERAILQARPSWKGMEALLKYQLQHGPVLPRRRPNIKIVKREFEEALRTIRVLNYTTLAEELGCTSSALGGKKGWIARHYSEGTLQEIKARLLEGRAVQAAHEPTSTAVERV